MSSTAIDIETVKKEVECPTCKGKFDLEIQRKKPKMIIEEESTTKQKTVEVPIVETTEKTVEKVPSHIPAYKCKNCGDNHKNKNYTQRPKGKCTNCGQFAKDSSGSCPWCNKEVEPIDEDELEDLGIPNPGPIEHMHEGE